jgi:hypothetical protein
LRIQARYHPSDPVEGGSANDYVYGFGDPINGRDLDGRCWFVSGHILPCGGDHPYIPQRGNVPVKFKGGGWIDAYNQVWKWDARGKHWDVTRNKGKGPHTNVTTRGTVHHRKDNFPEAAKRPPGWFPPPQFWSTFFVPIPSQYLRDSYCGMTNCDRANDWIA